MSTMICLVGEQPIPNLLPIRFLEPPQVLLVTSGSQQTQRARENLRRLNPNSEFLEPLTVPPYDLPEIVRLLRERAAEGDFFNLTGGTKTMAIAAYHVARSLGAEALYLESERGRSILYRYRFDAGEPVLISRDELPELLDVPDYVTAFGLSMQPAGRQPEPFEEAAESALRESVSEIHRAVHLDGQETDLIMRIKNRVGVAEVKSGHAARGVVGPNQLLSRTLRERLGTYTERFLILDREPDPANRALAEACRIRVIVLPSFQDGALSAEDADTLRREVRSALGANP